MLTLVLIYSSLSLSCACSCTYTDFIFMCYFFLLKNDMASSFNRIIKYFLVLN